MAWSMIAVRMVWDIISACPDRVGRLEVLFRIVERRLRLTDNWAFAGMKSWKIVASSDGRKADLTNPIAAEGEPYPPNSNWSVYYQVRRMKEIPLESQWVDKCSSVDL